MKFLHQTRLHVDDTPGNRGNCWPTVIACLLDLNSPEEVEQFQEVEKTHDHNWIIATQNWLKARGLIWVVLDPPGHQNDGQPYLVVGKTARFPDVNHVCIYLDGKLLHDPHPQGKGLITEEYFEMIIPMEEYQQSQS